MNIKSFPLCCGAYIVTDFGNTGITLGTEDKIQKTAVKKFLKNCVKGYGGAAFIIAILNKGQADALGETFEECEFKRIASGKNTSHIGGCHMYVYINPIPNKNS